ncbi:hypothetical protein ACYX34_14730 [Nitrospira sp. CMX1]
MVNSVCIGVYARIGESHGRNDIPIADSDALIDNAYVTNDHAKPRHQSFTRQMEYWFLSLGMSIIAYTLEKVILRSLKNSRVKP